MVLRGSLALVRQPGELGLQAVGDGPIYILRLAEESDIPRSEVVIPKSARALPKPHYSAAQIEAGLGSTVAVDRQLIRDRTYFVTERDGALTGCGGWNKRHSMYGGNSGRGGIDRLLDPRHLSRPEYALFSCILITDAKESDVSSCQPVSGKSSHPVFAQWISWQLYQEHCCTVVSALPF
jgi:hypothetical protein